MSRFIRGTAIGAGLLLASIGQGYAQEDTTPPQLVNLIINTPVIDTTAGDATAVITVRTRDDLSGPRTSQSIRTESPTGFQDGHGCILVSAPTPLDAIFECVITLRQLSPLGTYRIDSVTLIDNVLNTVHVSEADLKLRGLPTTFQNADLSGQPDFDNDGVPDAVDNCPDDPNPGQEDRDLDGIGDVCDPFPDDPPGEPLPDADFDGVADLFDNCVDDPNPDQADVDGDRVGNVCDNCVPLPNRDQKDDDGNGFGDVCDALDEFIGPNGSGDVAVSREEFEALQSEVSALQSAIGDLNARVAALEALGLSEEIQALKDQAAALEERLSKIEAIKQIENWLGKKPKKDDD
jgi:outer membrane murein-binding lipoprotein Lpp